MGRRCDSLIGGERAITGRAGEAMGMGEWGAKAGIGLPVWVWVDGWSAWGDVRAGRQVKAGSSWRYLALPLRATTAYCVGRYNYRYQPDLFPPPTYPFPSIAGVALPTHLSPEPTPYPQPYPPTMVHVDTRPSHNPFGKAAYYLSPNQ